MKYTNYEDYVTELKSDNTDILTELNSVVGDYLAYLKDDGFTVDIKGHGVVISLEISLDCVFYNKPFYWSDVQDYIIPFCEVLSMTYNYSNIINIYEKGQSSKMQTASIYEIEEKPYYRIDMFISKKDGTFYKK